jgi:hypothetical protein
MTAAMDASSIDRGRWKSWWISVWDEHRGFILIVTASTLCLLLLDWISPGVAKPLAHLPSALLTLLLVADLAIARIVLERIRTRAPWRTVFAELRSRSLATERILGLALVAMLTRWLLVAAVAWKTAIPGLHPFAFDVALANLDASIHGQDPWRSLAFLFQSGPMIRLIDVFYYLWFLAFAFVMLRTGWAPFSRTRRRFLTSMALTWTMGAVIAVLVSSGGPVYYGELTGDAVRFGALIDRINDLGLIAAGVRAALWEAYTTGSGSIIAGIAAFPSLHVAVPALVAVASRGRARWLWWAFTVLTLLGSVILSWHYAVDGYAGIAIAIGCWLLSGWLHPDPDARRQGARQSVVPAV